MKLESSYGKQKEGRFQIAVSLILFFLYVDEKSSGRLQVKETNSSIT